MKKTILILSILMIFAVACSSPEPQQPLPPKPEAKAANAESQAPAAPTQTAKTVQVAIKGFKFVPADATINVGDTIVWTNEDSAPHTVESSDCTLRSDELANGDIYSYKFTKAKKYDYICGIHPSMHGSVTVQ